MAVSHPEIELCDVSMSFGAVPLLTGLSLRVERGTCVCVTGASGTGKTTLLRLVNGLQRPDAGTVRVGAFEVSAPGADLDAARRHAGMVLQGASLFPHKTALENVAMGQRHVLGRSDAEARRRALELMERLGVAVHAQRWPAGLSAGQQQRLALARAMAMDPRVLLLDEVTAALDPAMVTQVAELLREQVAAGLTLLAASHDDRFVSLVADRIVHLQDGRLHPVGAMSGRIREAS